MRFVALGPRTRSLERFIAFWDLLASKPFFRYYSLSFRGSAGIIYDSRLTDHVLVVYCYIPSLADKFLRAFLCKVRGRMSIIKRIIGLNLKPDVTVLGHKVALAVWKIKNTWKWVHPGPEMWSASTTWHCSHRELWRYGNWNQINPEQKPK